jgi:FAD/FMN-containing dehydrogenase
LVDRVSSQLRARTSTQPVSFRKKAVSHQVPKPNDLRRTDDKIDLVDLDAILEIDPDARTCTVEPGVTFTDLVRATLEHGLVPMVVPELRTITVGGAVAGCSLESTSFKHGGFHDTCLAYEVITANGDVIRCTPHNEHRLVFQMMHGSFGTLGILSKLEIRLAPAKPFVHLVHETHATLAAFQDSIRRHFVDRDLDFMDGFVHSPSAHVLSVGRFVDDAPYANRYDWTKVYYRSTARRKEDYLRTPDYFFRYDNGVTNVHPKSAVGRLLFGKMMHSSQLLRMADKLHRLLPKESPDVTLDVFVPFSRMEEYLRWHDAAFGFYPLWCVPYRRVRDYEWIAPSYFATVDDPLFVDLAMYGMKQPPGRNAYAEIEEELLRVNGIKALISYNYYARDVFWRIYDQAKYRAVKRITDPNNVFRDVYDKTCLAPRGLRTAGCY